MIEWPDDLTRKNEDQDVPYDGYEHGNLVGTPGVEELLTVEHREYAAERDPIEISDEIQAKLAAMWEAVGED